MTDSASLYQRAQQVIPGGVNSPVRSFNSVASDPLFFAKGEGAYLTDVSGKKYIDYVGSWGPLILGHNHPAIIEAVQKAVSNGLSFGACTESEVQLAEKVCDIIPSIEQVRMVSSGTEATMTAIRIARGYTNRDYIIKFNGCYHGHSDGLLVKAGSGVLTLGLPSSAGVPQDVVKYTLTADYNNLDEVKQLFAKYKDNIAAIIIEPVAGNMGCILPQNGFLQSLRDICDTEKSLLIFDEVMTGFRPGIQGAQGHYNITPDLTTLGKIIGGGMPVGAIGGKKEIMQQLAPLGPVYQAGTLSGNPVAMAAGLAALETISQAGFYDKPTANTTKLLQGLQEIADKHNIPLTCNQFGTMFSVFFTNQPEVTNFDQVMNCNKEHFITFFHSMLEQGVYLAPSAFEAGFMSSAHSDTEIAMTLTAAANAMQNLC